MKDLNPVVAVETIAPKETNTDFILERLEGLLDFKKPEIAAGDSSIAPRELLNYQIQAFSYHLRVELLAKTAEGVSATTRRLQM